MYHMESLLLPVPIMQIVAATTFCAMFATFLMSVHSLCGDIAANPVEIYCTVCSAQGKQTWHTVRVMSVISGFTTTVLVCPLEYSTEPDDHWCCHICLNSALVSLNPPRYPDQTN